MISLNTSGKGTFGGVEVEAEGRGEEGRGGEVGESEIERASMAERASRAGKDMT